VNVLCSAKLIKITFAQYQTHLSFAKGKEAYLCQGAAEDGGLFFLVDVTLPSASGTLLLLFFCFLCSLFPGFFLFFRLCLRFQVSPVLFVPSSCVLLFWSFSLAFIPFLLFSSVLFLHPCSLIFFLLCLCSLCFL